MNTVTNDYDIHEKTITLSWYSKYSIHRRFFHELGHHLLITNGFRSLKGIVAEYLCEFFVAKINGWENKRCHRAAMTYVHEYRRGYKYVHYHLFIANEAKDFLIKEADKIKAQI